jgi:hypothetical protein
MEPGSRTLPLRHLSIRVPWHDSGWKGTICDHPKENSDCLILKTVHERREDDKEEELRGRAWVDLDPDDLPPCVVERAGFMAPVEMTRMISHPYSSWSQAHAAFRPTVHRVARYSASCIPFRWMLRENAEDIAAEYDLPYQPELEEWATKLIGGGDHWIQTKQNQVLMLETFFSAVRPEESLCFFYVKRAPLTEERRRILVGVGRVLSKGSWTEYRYEPGPGELRAVLWEWPIQHSIRPALKDGFLLPYHEILEIAKGDTSVNPEDYVAFAPGDHWDEFSFAAEHVTHDAAIGALLECARVIKAAREIVPGKWDEIVAWIDERLGETWQRRGAYPGLGSVLAAFGVPHANLLSFAIGERMPEASDPWPLVDQVFEDPAAFGLAGRLGTAMRAKWASLPTERRDLLRLLARFDLTPAQATRFYQPSDREKARIEVSDHALIENPYLVYELDRHSEDPITAATADRGLFPDATIRAAFPLSPPSAMEEDTDQRRVRALVVSLLEAAAERGHTLQPRDGKDGVIQLVRDMVVSPPCPIDVDLMPVIEPSFPPVIDIVEMASGEPAYQLNRLTETRELIRRTVEKRIGGVRLDLDADWATQLDAKLGGAAAPGDEAEQRAREEKVAALEELASSRFSVLIGPAGTGKTMLLAVLCDHPRIREGEILLLAPTGKARVQLEVRTKLTARTIAQFLLQQGGYDPTTGRYRISESPAVEIAKTVIIDESSMLTEEALAAVLSILKGVERLILVGDPRQLPPIGSGRPFVDIVTRVAPPGIEELFPRVGRGYADLTILRRPVGEDGGDQARRDDLILASWFGGQDPGAGADEVWARAESGEAMPTLRFVRWDTPEDLRERVLDVLVEELGLKDRNDIRGFEEWLGGTPYGDGDWMYFWRGRKGQKGASSRAEEWQILSPLRGQGVGVTDINRMLQRHFRARMRESATERGWHRRVPRPFGTEEIVYGDKVIQVINQRKKDMYPSDGGLNYVANGEIGVVVGQFKGKYLKKLPWKITVEFSSQPGFEYGYSAKAFGEEGNPPLELAYAITVHKSQGSEFGVTFLIIPDPCRILSRELLYTALTRQRRRVVVLHQGDIAELKRLTAPHLSETAARLTNLFGAPTPVAVEDRFLEERLIHRTRRGEAVRSKSEVIIADLLYSKKIDYAYERRLVGSDGTIRYPDFTIEDEDSGVTIYWEHLGLMGDPNYARRWGDKAAWYEGQSVVEWDRAPKAVTRKLVVSRDDEKGAIDSRQIEKLLDAVMGLSSRG